MRVKQGDTFQRLLTLTGGDGQPVDLTGASVEFSVAATRGGKRGWTWEDTPDQAEITNPSSGEILIGLTPDDTREFGGTSTWEYEVTVTFPNSTRLTVLDGQLHVTREVRNEP